MSEREMVNSFLATLPPQNGKPIDGYRLACGIERRAAEAKQFGISATNGAHCIRHVVGNQELIGFAINLSLPGRGDLA